MADSDEEKLKAALTGKWKLQSSTNVEQYLAKRNGGDEADLTFQLADTSINFTGGDSLSLYYQVGNKKYEELNVELSLLSFIQNRSVLFFISDFTLKCTWNGGDGSEEESEERYVSKDELYVISTRDTVTCTRIYKKQDGEDTCEKEKEELKKKIEELEEQLKKAGECPIELAKIKEDLAKKNLEVEELKKRIGELEEQLKNITKENEDLKKKIAELEEQLKGGCSEELAKVKEELAKKNQEIESLKTQLNNLTNENANLKSQIAQLQAELAACRNDAANLRNQVANLTAEIQRLRAQDATNKQSIASLQAYGVNVANQLRACQASLGGGGGTAFLQQMNGRWNYLGQIMTVQASTSRLTAQMSPSNVVLDYVFGQQNAAGYVGSVENGRIMLRNAGLSQREEWSMENGQLVITNYGINQATRAETLMRRQIATRI